MTLTRFRYRSPQELDPWWEFGALLWDVEAKVGREEYPATHKDLNPGLRAKKVGVWMSVTVEPKHNREVATTCITTPRRFYLCRRTSRGGLSHGTPCAVLTQEALLDSQNPRDRSVLEASGAMRVTTGMRQ